MLPIRPIEPDSILDFTLECRIPARPALDTAAIDFEGFREMGYVRGIYETGGAAYRFIFALPRTENLRIRFAPGILESWRKGNGYEMQVLFYALKWMSHSGIDKARTTLDRTGSQIVLIDSAHNVDLHRVLSDRFLTSFNSRDVVAE